jgi:hypothetical protein
LELEQEWPDKPDEVHLLVSSHQLKTVSNYFNKMFKEGLSETIADPTDRKYHICASG